MFVDKAEVFVKAGKGGDGAVSFHREKYISAGGPDGGDGGRGGSVFLRVEPGLSTLMDFKYKKKYVASDGANGASKNKKGKDGNDLIIRVPNGTVIRDKETGGIIADMSIDIDSETKTKIEDFCLVRGGNGGWGNKRFATPTRQAPRFSKPGLKGQELSIVLELKLIADVGLVGFPNVGKSTILSVVSKANPKIADYHFTTLHPNLGVVYVSEEKSFVMADIPGIIEGASEGTGLGHDFLRHIDRCRLVVHVVDISGSEGRDPINDFEIINEELKNYCNDLSLRPQIIVANKTDIAQDTEMTERFEKYISERALKLIFMSAATNKGVSELIHAVSAMLSELPPPVTYQPDYVIKPQILGKPEDLEIRKEKEVWVIEGDWVERLMQSVNFDDYESSMFFDRNLRKEGIYKRLEDMGIEDGDTIFIYGMEFDYER